jgi:hypothetical protein
VIGTKHPVGGPVGWFVWHVLDGYLDSSGQEGPWSPVASSVCASVGAVLSCLFEFYDSR